MKTRRSFLLRCWCSLLTNLSSYVAIKWCYRKMNRFYSESLVHVMLKKTCLTSFGKNINITTYNLVNKWNWLNSITRPHTFNGFFSWTKPNLNHIKVFGCKFCSHSKEKTTKLHVNVFKVLSLNTMSCPKLIDVI